MNKAINDIKARAEELSKVLGNSEMSYVTRMAPILMNAFKTRQFNRSHGVEVAACLLSLINIADMKSGNIDPEVKEEQNQVKSSRLIKFSDEI